MLFLPYSVGLLIKPGLRSDDKTAEEYNLEGGATLHLVLALRGGGAGLC